MIDPRATVATKVNGPSMAIASWFDELCTLWSGGFDAGLLSEGILGEPCERLRIQPGGEGDKYGDGESYGLSAGHDRTGRFAGLLEPGVDDDAEVVVERGNDVEDGEDGEHGMVRLDERKENEVLAHEAGGGRDDGTREHEDEKQDGGSGVALVERVQVLEFFADDALLAEHDDYSERAGSHEDVGEQVVGNSRRSGFGESSSSFVPGEEAEQDVTHVRNRGIGEQTFHIRLCQSGEVAPGERCNGYAGNKINPRLVRWRENRTQQPQEQRKTSGL